jgi:cytochrome c oxidase subunit I+III
MATVREENTEILEESWVEPKGLGSWIATVDHKRIGIRYLVTAMVLFVAGGLEALVIRIQLAQPNEHLVSPEIYNQMFTMHGVTMMFLFAVPVLSGFGNYLVPLMIGARDMAFPRLNAFGYWTFLAASIFMYSAFLVGHVPDAGWFNYTPLSGARYSPGLSIDFYCLGLIISTISVTGGAINFLVTILKMRAPGMSINRVPIFVWGELAMSFSVIFGFPPLTADCILLELQRRFGFHFFDAARGGDPLLWQHLFWIFGHPMVYIIILPALGMVSAMLPAFVRRRIVGYTWIVLAEMSTALIGFGVWTHHMFTTGLPIVAISFVSLSSFFITIPSGIQVFAWCATLLAGRPQLKTPMLFILGFLFVFVVGGLTGTMFAAVPFDQQVHDTYFVIAHFHYVMVGGLIFPLFAALYYWLPKMNGKLLNEPLGKWSFWVMFVGFNAAFFPMHIEGILGQPRRTYTYAANLGWTGPNLLSTIGAFVLAAGILMTFWNWFHSARRGKPAGNNPWDADTLEWATTSPPPEYNFESIPTVRSLEPVWDQPDLRDGAQPPEEGGRSLVSGHLTLSTSLLDGTPRAVVAMPHPTPAPFVATIGILVAFWGAVFGAYLVAGIGALCFAGGMIGWYWPRGETQET